MEKIILCLSVFIFLGCASKTICKTEMEEPISTCRANAECKPGFFGYLGIFIGAAGSGLTHQPNAAMEDHNRCIQNNLEAQKINAGI